MTQIPWCAEKLLVWDVTVVSSLAESCVAAAARGRGELAELAAAKKCEKYAESCTAHTFVPIAVETLGPMNESAYLFFMTLAEESATSLVTAAKHISFSSDCQSPCSASLRILSFCTTIRTSSHSTFVFRLLLYPRIYTVSGKK